jgi:exosortase
LLAALYAPTFAALGRIWQIDPNYSHGYIVVLASLLFAWRAWRRGGAACQPAVPRGPVGLGIITLSIGLGLHLVAWFMGMLLLDVVALVAVFRGTLLLLGGKPALKAYGFAALFLIFMAPLPIAWYQPVANALQQVVSSISARVLVVCGVPVFEQGCLLHLPGHTMEVGEACSGLRQLTAFLALTVAVGHLSNRTVWFKVGLVAMSLVIAVAANCVRILVTAWILLLAGPEWAEGAFHAIEGLVVIMFGLVLLLAVAWGLGALEDRVKKLLNSAPLQCGARG